MSTKAIILVFLLISVMACNTKQNNYIGHYKELPKNSHHTKLTTLHIHKIGNSYFAEGHNIYKLLLWDKSKEAFQSGNIEYIQQTNKQQIIVVEDNVVVKIYSKIN